MSHCVRGVSRLLAAGLFLVLPLAASAKTYTYKVRHLHAVGSCQGLLRIGETEIRYDSDYRADARIWLYSDIKSIDRRGERKVTFATYDPQTMQLGRDKRFDFEFLDGDVSDELYNFMTGRIGQPGPPTPVSPPGGRWEIAAKHLHMFSGCEGTLKITDSSVEYVTENARDGRLWKYMDIKRLDAASPYKLTIYTYEDRSWQLGRDRIFRFDLKEPLHPAIQDFIRQHMNR